MRPFRIDDTDDAEVGEAARMKRRGTERGRGEEENTGGENGEGEEMRYGRQMHLLKDNGYIRNAL